MKVAPEAASLKTRTWCLWVQKQIELRQKFWRLSRTVVAA